MNENKNSAGSHVRTSKIDREIAEAEFNRYCDNNEIEYDEAAMNDEEKDSFRDIKLRFIKNCMDGRVEVEGTSLKYTLSKFSPEGFRGETITLKRPGGHAFSAMDGYKEKESIHKLHAFMSAMTGKDVKYFSKIDISDWKFISNAGTLFLGL